VLLKIGPLQIEPGLALAPMAGITNHAFRTLAKEQGCRLLYTEMISAKGQLHGGDRNRSLLFYTEQERPLGFQLFGSDPLIMARAAHQLEKLGADLIDLNFGCPTRKITRNAEGGALMSDPARCREIFKAVVGAVSCPVTVKMRTGWDERSINCLEIARLAEESGLKAVTIHGRTVDQGYSGQADWAIIKAVKEKIAIPLIGNGDVDSPQSAAEMFSYTRCDGVMIGRAARGNPWIFSSILAWLKDGTVKNPPALSEITATILRHFKLLAEQKGELLAAREMRRHSAWYIRGFPEAASVRQKLLHLSNYQQLESILQDYCRHVEGK
jgi:tRNA-dihydrouridine synthase B